MSTLYRAIASSQRHRAEMLVFFELPGVAVANVGPALETVLSALWGYADGDLEIYNLLSEHEALGDWALGDAATGDMRLFESGCSYGTVLYHEPANTLMLVSPRRLRRLQAAQARLPIVVADDATRPMPLAA